MASDIDNGGDYASKSAVVKWEISVFSSQLCCKLKTTLKNKVKKSEAKNP